MNLKTVIALAIAAAFSAPVAAQTSYGTDNRVTSGTNAPDRTPNTARPGTDSAATGSSVTSGTNSADRPAGAPKADAPRVNTESNVTSGSNAADRPANTPKSDTPRAAAGGTAAASGFSALDRNNDGYISRDEARDASWSNRFAEFDKDNDGRLSQSEFDAMQAAAGASGARSGSSSEIRSGSGASTTGGMGGSVGPGGTQSGSSTSGIGDKPGQKQ